jgi:hypothetical protein
VADPGIKKVIIQNKVLGDVTTDNKYLLRYRIVSDDKNRVSAWSPVFSLNAKTPQPVSVENLMIGKVVTLVWDDEENRPQYDIFVKFDNQEYFYHGTSFVQTYTFIHKAENSFRFAIQLSGIAKIRNEVLEIYESEDIPLV